MGRRTLIASAVAGACGVAAAAAVADLSAARTLVLVAAVAAVAAPPLLVRALLDVEPPAQGAPWEDACRALARGDAGAPDRPSDLLALTKNAYDLDVHFRPFVRDVVRELLAVRARVDLAREPDRARALLGPELRELLWPRGRVSRAYTEPGLDRERLHRLLDELDELETIAA